MNANNRRARPWLKSFLVFMMMMTVVSLVLFAVLSCLRIGVHAQDAKPCHEDEAQVTDSNGGYHCVARQQTEEWNAEDCVREFKVNSNTKLVIPLDYYGEPSMNEARLEHFDFKLVCGVKK